MLKRFLPVLIILFPQMLMAQDVTYTDAIAELEFQIDTSNGLTLGDVVNAALLRSPDKFVVKSKELFSDALKGRAASFFADTPEISILHQNDSFRSNQGLREWQTSLEMPLWMPGQKSAAKNTARMAMRESSAYEKLTILDVTGLVREILWELKLREAGLRQAEKNLILSIALNDDINKKIKAGNLPRRDALFSQKEIMTRRMELLSAQVEYIHSAREYESITGLNQMPENIDEVKSTSADGENVPMIEFVNAQVDFREAEYKELKNSWSSSPKFSVGLKRERGNLFDQNINSVGFGLSIPLGAGVHMTSKRARSALVLADSERSRAMVARQHLLHLHEAEHELDVCEIQLPLSQSHFEMASQSLALGQKAFDMGESDLFDLLKIQEQYFQSSAQNITKIIECKRAIARHNQIKGILLS